MAHFQLMHARLGIPFKDIYNASCQWYHLPKANFMQGSNYCVFVFILASVPHCLFPATVVAQDLFDEFILEFTWLLICIYALRKIPYLLGTVVLQYDQGLCIPFLFQGSLGHCKHIISHMLCIPETRDIVHSWLLGSLFVKTKFYQRNCVRDLYCGEKCKIQFGECQSIIQTVCSMK